MPSSLTSSIFSSFFFFAGSLRFTAPVCFAGNVSVSQTGAKFNAGVIGHNTLSSLRVTPGLEFVPEMRALAAPGREKQATLDLGDSWGRLPYLPRGGGLVEAGSERARLKVRFSLRGAEQQYQMLLAWSG